jgi:cyanophycinase
MRIRLLLLFVGIGFHSCHAQENPKPTPTGSVNETFSVGITGDKADVTVPTQLGIVLMGGSTDVDEALQWMIGKAQGGDVVIIRASGSTGYNDYIYELGKVNSVETLLLDSREKAMTETVGKRIREAEMLFIAGGDQWDYVKFWKDTEVSNAIRYLIEEKKIPIGGTSAGCAILSGYIFDASHDSAYSNVVLKNPYDTTVSISKGFIELPYLSSFISDQHYSQREREGRHITFMTRMIKDFNIEQPKGIGVDEKTALCIDQDGNAYAYGTNSVYLLISEPFIPEQCEPGKPLTFDVAGKAVRAYIYKASRQGTGVYNLKENSPKKPDEFWSVKNGELKRIKN